MKDTLLFLAFLAGFAELGCILKFGWYGLWRIFCATIILEFLGSWIGLGGCATFIAIGGALMISVLYVAFFIATSVWKWSAPLRASRAKA